MSSEASNEDEAVKVTVVLEFSVRVATDQVSVIDGLSLSVIVTVTL